MPSIHILHFSCSQAMFVCPQTLVGSLSQTHSTSPSLGWSLSVTSFRCCAPCGHYLPTGKEKTGLLPPILGCQLACCIVAGADGVSASCCDFHSMKVVLPSSLSKYKRIAGSRRRANASIASAGGWYFSSAIFTLTLLKNYSADVCQEHGAQDSRPL